MPTAVANPRHAVIDIALHVHAPVRMLCVAGTEQRHERAACLWGAQDLAHLRQLVVDVTILQTVRLQPLEARAAVCL